MFWTLLVHLTLSPTHELEPCQRNVHEHGFSDYSEHLNSFALGRRLDTRIIPCENNWCPWNLARPFWKTRFWIQVPWVFEIRLDRLPIKLTSLPTYRAVRDLIFVSLYARVLHCLLLVSNYNSLEEYSYHDTHSLSYFCRYFGPYWLWDTPWCRHISNLVHLVSSEYRNTYLDLRQENVGGIWSELYCPGRHKAGNDRKFWQRPRSRLLYQVERVSSFNNCFLSKT